MEKRKRKKKSPKNQPGGGSEGKEDFDFDSMNLKLWEIISELKKHPRKDGKYAYVIAYKVGVLGSELQYGNPDEIASLIAHLMKEPIIYSAVMARVMLDHTVGKKDAEEILREEHREYRGCFDR